SALVFAGGSDPADDYDGPGEPLACASDPGTPQEATCEAFGTLNEDVVVAGDGGAIDSADLEFVAVDPEGESFINVREGATIVPNVGQIVVTTVGEGEEEAAFYGRVTERDGRTLRTTPASLMEVFDDLSLDAAVPGDLDGQVQEWAAELFGPDDDVPDAVPPDDLADLDAADDVPIEGTPPPTSLSDPGEPAEDEPLPDPGEPAEQEPPAGGGPEEPAEPPGADGPGGSPESPPADDPAPPAASFVPPCQQLPRELEAIALPQFLADLRAEIEVGSCAPVECDSNLLLDGQAADPGREPVRFYPEIGRGRLEIDWTVLEGLRRAEFTLQPGVRVVLQPEVPAFVGCHFEIPIGTFSASPDIEVRDKNGKKNPVLINLESTVTIGPLVADIVAEAQVDLATTVLVRAALGARFASGQWQPLEQESLQVLGDPRANLRTSLSAEVGLAFTQGLGIVGLGQTVFEAGVTSTPYVTASMTPDEDVWLTIGGRAEQSAYARLFGEAGMSVALHAINFPPVEFRNGAPPPASTPEPITATTLPPFGAGSAPETQLLEARDRWAQNGGRSYEMALDVFTLES
ncbi:MAG: hypothetical protein AAGK32_09280, partial [Actinomycetota bacterium]